MIKRTLANFIANMRKSKEHLKKLRSFWLRRWKIVLPALLMFSMILPAYIIFQGWYNSDLNNSSVIEDMGDVTPLDDFRPSQEAVNWPAAYEENGAKANTGQDNAKVTEELAISKVEAEPEIVEPALGEMVMPVVGQIVTSYGYNYSKVYEDFRFHDGLDLSVQRDTPVAAVLPGEVSEVEYNELFGYRITVDHGSGWQTRYSNLGKVKTAAGDQVKKGTVLGQVGEPGKAENDLGTHLHVELLKDGNHSDPSTYLSLNK